MAGSIVVALKAAVVSGLTTHLASLAEFNGTTSPERNVAVAYAYDLRTHDAERVFAGRARAETPSAAMKAGRNFRLERDSSFDLIVLVGYVGGSAQDAEARALAIGAEIEGWIADRKNNELGVTGLIGVSVDGWDLVHLMNDRGHMAELTYRVTWRARLT